MVSYADSNVSGSKSKSVTWCVCVCVHVCVCVCVCVCYMCVYDSMVGGFALRGIKRSKNWKYVHICDQLSRVRVSK